MTRTAVGGTNDLHRRRSLPRLVHLAAILALALTAAIRFYPQITRETPKADERVYLEAFRAVSVGESPYATTNASNLSFYYPPPFAFLGATALDLADSRMLVIVMRSANLLGLACCLWCSFLFAPLAWRWCLAAAVLYVAMAPVALVHGLRSGNLSFAVVGATLVSLAIWRDSALFAGVLLGLGTITKPITPVGLSTLAAHRPSLGGHKHWLAAGTGLAIAGALTLASPFVKEYLALDGDLDAWPLRRSVSLYRWLHLLGLDMPPTILVLLLALVTAWLARRSPLSPRRLYILAIVGMTLATPAHWSHTLLLVLPIEIMAVAKAWRRLRYGDASPVRLSRYELVLVLLGVAALQFTDGIGGGLETAAVSFQVTALAIPVWAPAALAMYVWWDPTRGPTVVTTENGAGAREDDDSAIRSDQGR